MTSLDVPVFDVEQGLIMQGLAGRIVAVPPKPKGGRNKLCPCGSGKKLKQCCGAA